MRSLVVAACLALLTMIGIGQASAQALEPIGGPYTADSNTVLLLHFDGNMKNDAATFAGTADSATRHSTNPGSKIYFLNNTGVTGMGQCVRLDNSAITDSTYLTIADNPAVDLTGSWTIEAWANIFSFGSGSSDWRWVPRVVMKPGDQIFYEPNYWLEMWGDNRLFHAGFMTTTKGYVSVTSENNMFTPGQWVHLTFIRDTTRHIIAQMVHDVNKKLLSFTAAGFTAADVPQVNSNPVHIGWAGALSNPSPSTDSWLDGFLDEIRISKVVRNFAGPPMITNTTVLANQSATLPGYVVNTNVQAFNPGGTITSVKLHYYVTKWDSVSMTGVAPSYTATIPAQVAGTQVKYYVSAIDNNNLRSLVPLTAEYTTNPQHYTFYVFQPNVQTLWLTFEEGTGKMPLDHSPNNSTITAKRIPTYSTDAKQGTNSLLLYYPSPGVSVDSGWVEAGSPFLAAEEFSLDFWAKPTDSTMHAERIIIYSMAANDWNNANFEISFRTGAKGKPVFTGRYWQASNLSSIAIQDTNIPVLNQWYHVIYERSAATKKVALVIRDANDALKFRQIVDAVEPPIMGGSRSATTMKIGRADTDPSNWWYIPAFMGKLDNVQLYNYPKAGITGIEDEPLAGTPYTFELIQNYPNPFNPTTRISFTLPQALETNLVIYDILGRRVKTLVNEELHAGQHYRQWDGTNDAGKPVATGMYVYRLNAGDNTAVKKMMLLR